MLSVSSSTTKANYYVQPQIRTSTAKPVKETVSYVPLKKIKGYATGYFGPIRSDYLTKEKYIKAIRMNGEGKFTNSGTKPRIGTVAADTRFYPFGTIIYIPEINFWGKVEDIGSKVKGEKHIDIFCGHGKKAERIAKAWGGGTPITFVIMKKTARKT